MEYDRVIYMDADGMPTQDLDHLFLIEFPDGISIAAPQAYWFKENGIRDIDDKGCLGIFYYNYCQDHCIMNIFPDAQVSTTIISTILMVIIPSQILFQRVKKHFGKKRFGSDQVVIMH